VLEQMADRAEAGRLLAKRLAVYGGRSDVVVLALPRGGVPVAVEIATALRAPLDFFLVRKLGVPGFEELAFGSIAMNGFQLIDPDVVEEFGLSTLQIAAVVDGETQELERREKLYRKSHRPLNVKRRTVILVDDGVVTGATMRAAINALRKMDCVRIIVAVGVAPFSTYLFLESEADEVISLKTPRDFHTVGQFYQKFPQVTDEEALSLLSLTTGSGARNAG